MNDNDTTDTITPSQEAAHVALLNRCRERIAEAEQELRDLARIMGRGATPLLLNACATQLALVRAALGGIQQGDAALLGLAHD